MKKFFLFLLFLFLAIVGIIFFHIFSLHTKQLKVEGIAKISLDEMKVVDRLAAAIRFRTVSTQEDDTLKGNSLIEFQHFLSENFPAFYAKTEKKIIGSSLVFIYKGNNSSLKPILMLAHQDVVPIEDSAKWIQSPFAGFTDAQFIYGRGTLDDKCGVMGILEAAEYLLQKGFQPERSIYFAFGSDEETGGEKGAALIAKDFENSKMEFESILDEGGTVIHEVIPGIKNPVALIGIAEKGYASIELTTKSEGGHSSMPPPHTAAGVMAAAVERIEKNPFPPALKGAAREMFSYLAPEMDFGSKLAFSNLWLMEKMVLRKLAKKNSTNAAIRTTSAVTMFNSGTKDNVLPVSAKAVVNFRILPGESTEEVLDKVRTVVADTSVSMQLIGHHNEPSAISDPSSDAFHTLNKSIREVFPEALVAPYLVLGSTDSKHYAALSKNILRFLPIFLGPEDLKRIHGNDERIEKSNYLGMVRFYVRYMENASVSEARK